MAVAELEPIQTTQSTEEDRIREALEILEQGVLSLLEYLDKKGMGDEFLEDLEHCSQFIQQMQQWCGRMPIQRLREATYTLLRNLFFITFQALEIDPLDFQNDPTDETLPGEFLIQAAVRIGPDVTASNDNMSAFVQIPSILLPLWNVERLQESLEQSGITHGVEESALASVFDEKYHDTQLRIARGHSPVLGKDAVIIDEIQLINRREKSLQEDQQVDHREVRDFKPVKAGQILYRKESPTEGEAGFTVYGEPIPSTPGLDEKLPAIKNCSLSQDGLQLQSDVDGCVYLENGKVVVVPALVVPGNVDYSIGNIKTEVGVSISGNVLSEFIVESQSDIAVQGVVEAAYLTAGNNMFVKGGVNGKEKAILKAGNTVSAKYLNETTVKAGSTISVKGSVIHCHMGARRIASEGDSVQIIGGRTYAWDDVCVGVLGSDIGVKTEIILGAEVQALEKRLEKAQKKLKEKLSELNKLLQMRNLLLPQNGVTESLSLQEKKKLKKILNLSKEKKAETKDLEHAVKLAETELAASQNSVRMVRAKKAIHPGTIIKILDQSMKITQTLGPTNIIWMDGKLVKGPYSERPDDKDEMEE